MKRKCLILLLITLSLSFSSSCRSEESTQTTQNKSAKTIKIPEKKLFHIYVLMGQSNMMGRGKITPQDSNAPLNPKILAINKQGYWQIAKDPLHFDNPKAGVGMGISFAESMLADNNSVTIGLVPCAYGGSRLSLWEKDKRFYKTAIERTRFAQKKGTLKGFLWLQGESDGKTKKATETYSPRLVKMIADLRKDLDANDIPFIVGNIGLFIETHPHFPYAKNINAQLTELPKKVPYCQCVSSQGLSNIGDNVHFDAKSQRILGKRYAEAMINLKNRKKENTSDLNDDDNDCCSDNFE